MDYKEFNTELRKARVPRHAKVRGSWGVYDAYKLIRKHQWYDIGRPLKEHEFYSIIRSVNKLFAGELAKGNEMKFPCRMGNLELRKFEVGASFVGGKLKVTYPIDWGETMRLWYENGEAMKNKTLVRNEIDFAYYIKYNKHDANYENQSFYQFVLNRFIGKALAENIKKGIIDTLW